MDATYAALFRREPFVGQYAGIVPRWHIVADGWPDSSGTYAGLCGYSRVIGPGEVRLGATVSVDEVCYNCLKEARHVFVAPSPKYATVYPLPPAHTRNKEAEAGWFNWFRQVVASRECVTMMDAYIAGFNQGRTPF